MSPSKKSDQSPLQFESSIQKLKQLLDTLENPEVSLEESLKAFEEGIRLTQQAQQVLAESEQRVTELLEKNGELQAGDQEG